MNYITLDFETYYDKKYSLSKLTTEEYIRSDQFEVIGVAVKVNDKPPTWFTSRVNDEAIHNELVSEFLKMYDMDNSVVIAHNAMFDGAILSWIYDLRPKYLFDTMLMSRLIRGANARHSLKVLAGYLGVGQKGTEVLDALGKHRKDFSHDELRQYGAYCKNDVELTKKIFDIFITRFGGTGFDRKELQLMDLTLKMFTEPEFEIDVPLLETHLKNTIANKEALLADSGYNKDTLMSNPKFAEVLYKLGVVPPTKISPRTNKKTYAFAKSDEGFKELLTHEDVRVQAIANARIGVKSTLEETRTERFIAIGGRGKLPIPLRYYASHTGRWGGTDKINLQNLPSRGASAGILKRGIKVPEGYMLIDADSSQIEARTLAWWAEQQDLIDAFLEKKDVYKIMASKIYNKPIYEISKEERFIGKSVILGCGYGMGHVRFRDFIQMQGVDISEKFAQDVIDTYRTTNSKITELWREVDYALKDMNEGITSNIGRWQVVRTCVAGETNRGFYLPNKALIRYPYAKKETDGWGRESIYFYDERYKTKKSIYGAKAVENIVQGLARCIIGEQMLKIAKRYRVLLTVHDAVCVLVKDDDIVAGRAFVEECMRWTPDWAEGLPLDCESGVGKNYGDCK